MPRGLAYLIGVMAVILFLGSGAILILAAQRVGSGGGDTSKSGAAPAGGLNFGPSSAKSGAAGDPLVADPQLADIAIPPFEFADQHGQTVTNGAFAGKLTVVDFFFTHCPLVCPTLSGQMAGIAAKVADPRLQLVSISVDPEHDTPERLKEYAGQFGTDARWRFLRGSKEATWKLVREGIKFGISEDQSTPITLPDGSTMFNVRHPVHLMLVGPKGEVLGMYTGTHDDEVEALVDRIRRALAKMN